MNVVEKEQIILRAARAIIEQRAQTERTSGAVEQRRVALLADLSDEIAHGATMRSLNSGPSSKSSRVS
jgi:hypothetical protein